jgi:hypothetical protein
MVYTLASTPKLPTYLGPFETKEIAERYMAKHSALADFEILPLVNPAEWPGK